MRVRFTFKHMASSKALIEIAESKLANLVRRFKPHPHHIAVTVDTDGPLKKMRASLITQDGRDIEAVVKGDNIFSLVDNLVQKLDVQLRRKKDRKNVFKNKWKSGFKKIDPSTASKQVDQSKNYWTQTPIDAADILKLPPTLWGPVGSNRAS